MRDMRIDNQRLLLVKNRIIEETSRKMMLLVEMASRWMLKSIGKFLRIHAKQAKAMQTGLPNQQQFFLPLQLAKRIERGSENLRKVIGSPLST